MSSIPQDDKPPAIINLSYIATRVTTIGTHSDHQPTVDWVARRDILIGLAYSDQYQIRKDEYIVNGEYTYHHIIAVRKITELLIKDMDQLPHWLEEAIKEKEVVKDGENWTGRTWFQGITVLRKCDRCGDEYRVIENSPVYCSTCIEEEGNA